MKADARGAADAAWQETRRGAGGNGPDAPPVITVTAGKRHLVVDEAIAALVQARAPIYQRSAQLVRVCLIPAKTWDGETIEAPGIFAVLPAFLEHTLGTVALWQRFDARKKEHVAIDPPAPVVSQILGMAGEWPFKPLVGVIACPTLRPNGSLLCQPGYDDATGLVLYHKLNINLPDKPTRDDARAALAVLDELLAEFPFEDEASRAAAFSMVITPVARGAMPVAPAHLTTSPEAGTGKSYLIDIVSMIASGERIAVTSFSTNPEETEKRLISAALSGRPLISLDNCGDTIRGDFLCQLVERPILEPRVLGSNDKPKITNSWCVFANGNNVAISDDMVRRAIHCRLDANTERPETRTFKGNPLAAVAANRGRYVGAALTIVRAYLAAGSPNKLPPLASFEAWSDRVRSALVWLGMTDPLATMEGTRAEDPLRDERVRVFLTWRDVLGMQRDYTMPEIIDLADATYRPKLRSILLEIARKHGPNDVIEPRRLGKWLAKNRNAVINGVKLQIDRADPSRPRYGLRPV
jgi:putative DNA primase/helicase